MISPAQALQDGWQTLSIDFEQISLSLIRKGSGTQKVLLCMHGYDQRKEQFVPLFKTVPADWTILSLDQPAHGETTWEHPTRVFDADFMRSFWQELQALFPNAEFYLMGFSMGGKIASRLMMVAPYSLQKVILIAAGGFKEDWLSRFFFYRSFGRSLYGWVFRHPQTVLRFMKLLYKVRLATDYQYRFMRAQFGNPTKRRTITQTWQLYGETELDLKKLNQSNQAQPVEWHVIWGEQDMVLPAAHAHLFKKYIPDAELHFMPGPHLLIEEHPDQVKAVVEEILFD